MEELLEMITWSQLGIHKKTVHILSQEEVEATESYVLIPL